jgi:cell division protein FtsI/penicillin-binding protein 2
MEEIGLRGWVFDRRKKASEAGNSKVTSPTKDRRSQLDDDSVLAGYRVKNDSILRHYPLGADAAHLIGYSTIIRGSAGVELAYEGLLRPKPGKLKGLWTPSMMGDDLTLTVDSRLQRAASALLAQTGLAGAIVVLSVLTGDVLALASSPTFDPVAVEDDERWQEVSSGTSQRLVNRTLRRYYLPGSTFKTIIAAAALENGMADATFRCAKEGYRPGGTIRPIYDDGGVNEVHGTIGLTEALRVSCNQYFAQLGVALGPERLSEMAKKFGFQVDAAPDATREPRYDDDVWDNKEKNFRRLFSPSLSRLVLSNKIGTYDLALESYGQGYLQVTPLQMALVAQAMAHPSGQMMAPRLDFLSEPRVLRESMSAKNAAQVRAMMAEVTTHPAGTAVSAFAQLYRAGIATGGKTGTAQFETAQGHRVDSWFIGFAPLNDPQIAYAVVVEGGGYGGRVAAPMAAVLVNDALRLGIIRRSKP